jgi:hypothetical protein
MFPFFSHILMEPGLAVVLIQSMERTNMTCLAAHDGLDLHSCSISMKNSRVDQPLSSCQLHKRVCWRRMACHPGADPCCVSHTETLLEVCCMKEAQF